jgi:hypothetical protein
MIALSLDPNKTPTQVAAEVGCSRTLATKAWKALGLDRDHPRRRPGYHTFRAQIWDEPLDAPVAAIAEEIGCSVSYVRRIQARRVAEARRRQQRQESMREREMRATERDRIRRRGIQAPQPDWICSDTQGCQNQECMHWFDPPRNLLDCDCRTCMYLRTAYEEDAEESLPRRGGSFVPPQYMVDDYVAAGHWDAVEQSLRDVPDGQVRVTLPSLATRNQMRETLDLAPIEEGT